MRICNILGATAVTLAICAGAAQAELAISANDGKQLRAGDPTPVTPDSVTVIDMGHYPPKILGTTPVPASMIGPPGAVAVGPGEKFAIITAAEKVDPANPAKPAPDDKVSVIDLTVPSSPKVIQTLTAGPGASGVSINRAGTLALVAGKGDDSIYIYTVAGNKLTPAGKVTLDPKSNPTDVVFTPDGRKALVVAQGISKIVELAVNGSTVTRTGNDVAPGRQPYGAVVTPDGAYSINTNLGGSLDVPVPERVPGQRVRRVGTISMIDLKAHKLVASADVGPTPEHVALSADGKYAVVVVANGTASAKSDPKFASVLGVLRVFRVGAGTLTEVATSDSGHWCQGATWSNNGKVILLQCATEREIEVFRFDGKSLVQDKAASLPIESRPGSIATLRSR
jgi:DNA-binding beta-propeller fold protein YncE